MAYFFVNLKRFDIPKEFGGISNEVDSQKWITNIFKMSEKLGLGEIDEKVIFFLPQSVLISAKKYLEANNLGNFIIGAQGVYRESTVVGGNFGAFTTHFPASAAKNIGCEWAIIGHSEERKSYYDFLLAYDNEITTDDNKREQADNTIGQILKMEATRAFENDINVLLCVGEKVSDNFEKEVTNQLTSTLEGLKPFLNKLQLVIGYEPVWAIGPGKTPPGAEYISMASSFVKKKAKEILNQEIGVVYGGGLNKNNAQMLASIDTIDGGLIALTQFTGDIGFYPEGLKEIITNYKSVR